MMLQRRAAILALGMVVIFGAGCAQKTASPAAPAEAAVAHSKDGADCPQPSAALRLWLEGCPVRVRGRIAREPSQHLIGRVSGKNDGYLDLEDGSQVVVYVGASPPACTGPMVVEGKVIEVSGPSKRQGRPSKAEPTLKEKQIDVSAMRCEED